MKRSFLGGDYYLCYPILQPKLFAQIPGREKNPGFFFLMKIAIQAKISPLKRPNFLKSTVKFGTGKINRVI